MRFRTGKYAIPEVMIRERILEAAFSEFGENGFHATSIDTIASRAGVSRVVFYSYFKNKTEALICLLEILQGDLSPFLQDKRSHKRWLNTDSIDTFQDPVVYLCQILADSSGIIRAFVQGMLVDDQLFSRFSGMLEEIASIFEPKVRSIQSMGWYQGVGPQTFSQVMAVALVMSIFSVSMGAFRCSIQEMAEQLALFYFAFFRFSKGNANNRKKVGQKSQKTRQVILDAARYELASSQSRLVTMADIAQRAGVNRSTVYLYFRKKEEIVNALSGYPGQAALPMMPEVTDETGSASATMRRQIVQAAKQVFSDRGYADTSVAMIAAAASCSRNTIYKYFQGKDGIVKVIFDEMFLLFRPAIRESDSIIHQTDTASIDSLMKINSLVVEIFETYADVYRALLQGALQSTAVSRKFIDIYGQIDEPLQTKIRKLQNRGKCNAVRPEIASRIMQTYHAHSIWMFHAGILSCSRQELIAALAQFQFAFFNFS